MTAKNEGSKAEEFNKSKRRMLTGLIRRNQVIVIKIKNSNKGTNK